MKKLNILFIHTVFDSQFIHLHDYLNSKTKHTSYMLCSKGQFDINKGKTGNVLYFDDIDSNENNFYYSGNYESASKISKKIEEKIKNIISEFNIDAVVYHQTYGSIHLLLDIDIPKIHYLEFISYKHFGFKKEYQPTIDQRQYDVGFEALSYLNIINSDYTIVPSLHVKESIPKELQKKVIIQMEGFDTKENIDLICKPKETDKLNIGFFARNLDSSKGFDKFCEIIKGLNDKGIDFKCTIVGNKTGGYSFDSLYYTDKSMMDTLFEKYGLENIDYEYHESLPYDEFQCKIKESDIILYPLYSGSGCWGLFEDMMLGKIVIASDRAFIPEIIKDGYNGYIIPYDDTNAFVKKIIDISLNLDKHKHIGENAYSTIKNKFGLKNMASGYLSIINKVILAHGKNKS